MANIPDDFTITGLVSGDALKTVATSRSRKILKKTVSSDPDHLEKKYLSEGWTVQKKLKSGGQCHIVKEKEPWVLFEDQIWSLFYRMGFEELNAKSVDFAIPRYDTSITKQIDVFARSERTICIIECKSTETPHTPSSSLKTVKDAINEMGALKTEYFPNYIYKHYHHTTGIHANYKIVWILALKNIDLSKTDKELAAQHQIIVLDDATIAYYEQLSKQFGHASKYMFLGQYLESKRIPGDPVIVPAIRGKMGGYQYYSFSATPESLLRISFLAHRGNTNLFPDDAYQRIAKKKRLDSIAEYIKSADNGKGVIFPTSIVLNFSPASKIRFEENEKQKAAESKIGYLYLPNEYNSAWVIDGQHRLYAYSKLDEEARETYLPVIAFDNLPASEQAQLFVDINGKQEKVESTLLNEIKANILSNSPKGKDRLEAMYSKIAIILNTDRNSVLFDRIVEANVKSSNPFKNITNTTLISELKKSKLIGSTNQKDIKSYTRGYLDFQNMEQTCKFVASLISGYYEIFLENPMLETQWNLGKQEGRYLCTNHGIKSTLRLLTYILWAIQSEVSNRGGALTGLTVGEIKDKIRPYLQPVISFLATASENELKAMRQNASESGVTAVSDHFVTLINDQYSPNFQPDRANAYREKYSEENRTRKEDGKTIGDQIENLVKESVVIRLKDEFGHDINGWWSLGVPDKVIARVSEEAAKVKDFSNEFEKYLTFTDLYDIIFSNSELFGSQYVINAKERDPKKIKYGWLKRCAELKVQYSIDDGGIISLEDLAFLSDLHKTLSLQLGE